MYVCARARDIEKENKRKQEKKYRKKEKKRRFAIAMQLQSLDDNILEQLQRQSAKLIHVDNRNK